MSPYGVSHYRMSSPYGMSPYGVSPSRCHLMGPLRVTLRGVTLWGVTLQLSHYGTPERHPLGHHPMGVTLWDVTLQLSPPGCHPMGCHPECHFMGCHPAVVTLSVTLWDATLWDVTLRMSPSEMSPPQCHFMGCHPAVVTPGSSPSGLPP